MKLKPLQLSPVILLLCCWLIVTVQSFLFTSIRVGSKMRPKSLHRNNVKLNALNPGVEEKINALIETYVALVDIDPHLHNTSLFLPLLNDSFYEMFPAFYDRPISEQIEEMQTVIKCRDALIEIKSDLATIEERKKEHDLTVQASAARVEKEITEVRDDLEMALNEIFI
jgi:hypothetical protein